MEYNDLARIRSLISLYPHRRTANLLEGDFPSVYRSRGTEFDSLAEYMPGDDVRDIDWKASSGTEDSILVRKYVAARKYNVLLIGDVGLKMSGDTSGGESKQEIAVMCMGAVAYLAGACGADYALLTVLNGRIRPGVYRSGVRHLEEMLWLYRRALSQSASEESRRPPLSGRAIPSGLSGKLSRWINRKPSGTKPEENNGHNGNGTEQELIRFAAQNLRPNRIAVMITDQAGLAYLDSRTLERITWRDDLLVINIDDAYLTDGKVYDLERGLYADRFFLGSRKLREEEHEQRRSMLSEREHTLGKYRVSMVTVGSEKQIVPRIVELFEKAKVK